MDAAAAAKVHNYPKSHQLTHRRSLTPMASPQKRSVRARQEMGTYHAPRSPARSPAMDNLRVAAIGLHAARSNNNGEARIIQLEQALADAIALASDNAQCTARTQLEGGNNF